MIGNPNPDVGGQEGFEGGARADAVGIPPCPPLAKGGVNASTLVIGIGNPSRGDDALGVLAIEALEAWNLPGVECLTDFQLQVEHALDLEGRERAIFIDAAASGAEPFEFRPLHPSQDLAHTSHALAPEMVLGACARVGVTPPARCHVLGIRGYTFELGEPLNEKAAANLAAALTFLRAEIAG